MPIPGQFTTLRVRWPRTIDGVNKMTDAQGNDVWAEMELPVTARPHLEKLNRKLPIHLRKIITEMNYQIAPPAASLVKGVGVDQLNDDQKAAKKEIEDLKAKLAEYENDLDPEQPVKRGPGRPALK